MISSFTKIGVVVIGRNEGDRLIRSLESVISHSQAVVYVDSGSTDGSCGAASDRGVEVVNLELSTPFTAARARNAGFAQLQEKHPNIEYVQFIDGDCEVVLEWLETAVAALDANPDVVAVCGRRRERFPDASVYNRLCDMEWNTPVGEAKYFGGDVLLRVRALQQVGGYNPTLIAGEEPELCVRLRQKGGKILRIDADMTMHDAQITRFGQWWKRSLRAGYAYAEGAWLHGAPPERHWVRESRRIWFWGVALPVFVIATIGFTHGLSLLLLLAYPVMFYKNYRYTRRSGHSSQDAAIYAFFCTIDKCPQAQGQLRFYLNKLLGQRSTLIEYNAPVSQKSSIS